jgi:hypothetical protein
VSNDYQQHTAILERIAGRCQIALKSDSQMDEFLIVQTMGDASELRAAINSLRADAARYQKIRAARNFVGMLEFATAHADTDADYDAAVDRLPVSA